MTTSVTTAPPPTSTPDGHQLVRRRRRRRDHGWAYLAPAFILVLGVTAYPLYFALQYSLHDTRMWVTDQFVGLENYTSLLADPTFRTSVLASAAYVFGGVMLCTVLGTGVALALRHGSFASRLVRTVVMIPWITSEVVVAITWRWMLNPQYGPLAALFESLGLPEFPNVFASGSGALTTLVLVNVWRSLAFPMLMALAALQTVPREVEQAAEVDGASRWQRIRYVLIPSIMPVTIVTFIVLTINYFNMVVLVLDLTGGGPMGATQTLGLRLYFEAFQYFNVDTAATLTMVMLIVNFILAIWYFRALRRQAGGEG
jgi:multiple sugar transport system permease protein